MFNSLTEALSKFQFVVATTNRKRFLEKKIIKSFSSLNRLVKINKKTAILFGPENSGLSNEEISYANCVLQIPTNPKFKSLNLSHSLIIICQLVASILRSKTSKYSKSNKIKIASKADIQAMVNFCVNHLDQLNFFKPKEKKHKMIENLKSIFYKMDLSKKEIRILSSVFAILAKKRLIDITNRTFIKPFNK